MSFCEELGTAVTTTLHGTGAYNNKNKNKTIGRSLYTKQNKTNLPVLPPSVEYSYGVNRSLSTNNNNNNTSIDCTYKTLQICPHYDATNTRQRESPPTVCSREQTIHTALWVLLRRLQERIDKSRRKRRLSYYLLFVRLLRVGQDKQTVPAAQGSTANSQRSKKGGEGKQRLPTTTTTTLRHLSSLLGFWYNLHKQE